MGNVLIGALCMAFCFGLNGTLESKVSQAFGSNDHQMCGVWLNRGRMINSCLMIPLSILFLSSGYLLKAVGQDPEISDMACLFTSLMIPGTWAMVQFDATKRYATSQFKTGPPFYTQLITTFFHLIWCYIFIMRMQMTIVGAAIALNLTYFLNMVILDFYISKSADFEQSWIHNHDRRSF